MQQIFLSSPFWNLLLKEIFSFKLLKIFQYYFNFFFHIRYDRINWYILTNFHLLKLIDPIPKYPHITDAYGCIL